MAHPYDDHVADMAWMFSSDYGFHTQADRDANPDYHWSLANLIGFASRVYPDMMRPVDADLDDVAWFLRLAKLAAHRGNSQDAKHLIEDAECYLIDARKPRGAR